MNPARSLASLLVALLLAVTSVTAAAARGQALAAGEVVICSGGQVVTLRLDAEGNPVGPAHVCPDCVLSALAGPVPGPPALSRAANWSRAAFAPLRAAASRPASGLQPRSRGPPPLV